MSNVNLDAASNPTQSDWLGDIPGGDVPFDQLFSDQTGFTDNQPQTTVATEPSATAQSQTLQSDYVLETKTGTKYRTLDDAKRGTEEKDALIENMRQRLIAIGGVDPITGRPVGGQPNSPTGMQNSSQGGGSNYTQDRQRYLTDLVSAAESGNPDAYVGTQAKFVFDLLSPYLGPIQDVVKTRAMDSVKQEIPEFDNFRKSEQYSQFLDRFPSFKAAIEGSEQDFRFHQQLPELYRLAYLASQGSKVPELLQQQAQAQHAATAPPQTRPVTSSSAMAPATSNPGVRPSMQSSEGRQALIRELEGRGIDKRTF